MASGCNLPEAADTVPDYSLLEAAGIVPVRRKEAERCDFII